jgi:hypothetical protein
VKASAGSPNTFERAAAGRIKGIVVIAGWVFEEERWLGQTYNALSIKNLQPHELDHHHHHHHIGGAHWFHGLLDMISGTSACPTYVCSSNNAKRIKECDAIT